MSTFRASTMAEISSANDGDEGFGDFKFASFPNPTVYFNQINGADFADDEWGDFVVHPLSNALSHIPSSSKPSQTSIPFDPFGFFPNDSAKPSESSVSPVASAPTRSESEKKQWVKPQGALPLSIFGEEEEKESDSSQPAQTFDHKRVDSAKHGPKVDPVAGTNDIISNLYSQNQPIKAENGLPPVPNGRNLNSNSDSNVLHADLVDGNDGLDDNDDDDGWEFKGAVSENSKVQVGSGLLGLEVETTAKQEMQAGQENSDRGKYGSGFHNAFDGSSDFFAASNGLWQESSDGAKRMSGVHSAPDNSGDFFAASNGRLWQENSGGAKNESGFHHTPHNSSSFFDASDGLWQENSEGAKNASGFHHAPHNSSSFFDASNGLWQENSEGSKNASGFHHAPHNSSSFFDASNGLWQENSEGAKNASGFHHAPHNSSSFFDASNGLWQESEGTKSESEGTKSTSGFHNAPDNSTGFFDASNGLWQESKGSGFHIAPDNSRDLFDASKGLWQEPEGAKPASGSHNGPGSSSGFFDASNGLWQENPEASKQASGLHNAPDGSAVLFAASNELWQENSGGAKYTSGFINAPDSSTDFFSISNELWQENAQGTKTSSGFHDVTNSFTDSFAVSNGLSYEPSKLDIGFDLKPTTLAQNDSIVDSNSIGKLIDSENILKPYLGDENVDPDENFGEFKDAFSSNELKYEEEQKVAGISHPGVQVPKFDGGIQENEGRAVNNKGALPLSMFSDGELETDDSLNHQDFLAYKPDSNPRNGTTVQASNISINDLISSLYQSEPITSVDSAQKPSEHGFSFAETVLDSDIANGGDDFDDDSWEFKDAFSGAKAEDLTSGHGVDNAHQNFSTKVELQDYVDFYLKLKDESCFVACCHLDSLKKAKTAAALSGEDLKAATLDEEIKEACKELSQESMLPKEVHPENGPPRNICLDGFLEDLCGPKFQVLESEYHLSRRLLLAEKDLRSAVELFKHATSILKILMLGSMEELTNYVSTWSRMISVCAQELKHGAFIWKQSLQKNVHSQILLEPLGQKFILALGEIYRVVEVLGASARLFKLWVLLCSAKVDIFVLLEECSTIWSSSGLVDALHCICDPVGFEYDGTVPALLASIKHVHDLDVLSLQNHIFAQQKPICQLSLLTPELVPGMKMVAWNGNNYFLMLANLWANLISSDPPKLPDLQIG